MGDRVAPSPMTMTMSSSSQALWPAKTEETVSHHQNNRCYGGGIGNIASAKQLVYFEACSFNFHHLCGSNSQRPDNQLLKSVAYGLWSLTFPTCTIFWLPELFTACTYAKTKFDCTTPKQTNKKVKQLWTVLCLISGLKIPAIYCGNLLSL